MAADAISCAGRDSVGGSRKNRPSELIKELGRQLIRGGLMRTIARGCENSTLGIRSIRMTQTVHGESGASRLMCRRFYGE